MEKKLTDDELDKLLEEQFIKEADIIEEALFSDKDFEDFEETDEEVRAAYDKLVARLKADGVYREENDSAEAESSAATAPVMDAVEIGDKAEKISASVPTPEKPENKVIPMRAEEKRGERTGYKRSHKIWKVAGWAAACIVGVFVVSMTSEANRNYFIKSVRYLAGDDTRIVVSNDENNDKSVGNEYEAIETIEKQLDVNVPEIMYRPTGFEYKTFKVDNYSGTARIEYQYNQNIILFYVDQENLKNASKIDSLHGDSIESFPINEGEILVSIKEIKDAQDLDSSYIAQWEKNNVVYTISGKIEKDELIKMLEQLAY